MADELTKVAEESARGGFFLVAGSIIATVVSAIASIMVGRFLGAELYGQYVLALVVPQMLFLFTDFGINQGLIKFSAGQKTESDQSRTARLIQNGMIFKAAVGLAIFIVNFAFADYFAALLLNRPDLGAFVRIASIGIIFQVIFTTAASAFVGLDKSEYNAFTTNIQALAKAIMSVALVLLGLSVAGAIVGHIFGYLISGIAGTCLLFFMLRKFKGTQNGSNFTKELRTLMSYGIPLYLSLLLIGFIQPYQNLILAMFASDADVGNFKAANNFVTLVTVLSIPITTSLLPAFSKLNSSPNKEMKAFFKFSNKYTTMLILPTAIVMIVFADEIVQIIYGSTFQSAGLFLSLYCTLYFLVGFGYLNLLSMFNGLGETQVSLRTSLITVLVFVVLAPFSTQRFGVSGSIVAFVIATAGATAYAAYMARTRFGIVLPIRSMPKIYLASLAAAVPALLVLRFFDVSNLLKVTVGGILYLFAYITLIPLVGIITKSELEKATVILRKITLLNIIAKPFIKYEKIIIGRFLRTDSLRNGSE